MIDVSEFLECMNSGKKIADRPDISECMHWLSQEALRLTTELNGSYHTPEEIREIMEKLTGKPVDTSFNLFPPFHTECGKNLTIVKNVFLMWDVNFRIREESSSVMAP